MDRKRVGILIFPNVEVLDFCGPFEVFSVTRLDEDARREEPSPFEVLLVAESDGRRRRHGRAEGDPRRHARDLPAARHPGRARRLGHARRDQERSACWTGSPSAGGQVETLTSVCTGSMLLGQAGLLDGRRATTHWRSLDWMRESFPAVTVEDEAARRRGRPRHHLGRHLGRHRHGAARRDPLLRRGRRRAPRRATWSIRYPDDNSRRV